MKQFTFTLSFVLLTIGALAQADVDDDLIYTQYEAPLSVDLDAEEEEQEIELKKKKGKKESLLRQEDA